MPGWHIVFCLLPPANHMFQYFITIVPTKLNTYKVSAETNQYSVTEQVCTLDTFLYICVAFRVLWWIFLCSSIFSAGASDKPCCGQPWSLRNLHEIRYQLTDGQSYRAAHASLAVPCQALWHHWRHFLYNWWIHFTFNVYIIGITLNLVGSGNCKQNITKNIYLFINSPV